MPKGTPRRPRTHIENQAGADFDRDAVKDPVNYPDELRAWLAEQNVENLTYTSTLYRRDPIAKKKKLVVQQWFDEIPTANFIGMTFGPGEYLLIVSLPRGDEQEPTIRVATINIDANYNTLRAELGLIPGQRGPGATPAGVAPPAAAPPAAPTVDPMAMVERVISLLVPLLEARRSPTDDVGGMVAMYEATNKILQRNLVENMTFSRDVSRRLARLDSAPLAEEVEEVEVETVRPKTLLEQAMPFVQLILPKLLDKGEEGASAVEALKALPQFQAAMQNEKQLAALIAGVESEIGKAKTTTLLKKLGIGRA